MAASNEREQLASIQAEKASLASEVKVSAHLLVLRSSQCAKAIEDELTSILEELQTLSDLETQYGDALPCLLSVYHRAC